MIHFKVADIECVTDAHGKTLGIDGTPDVVQMNQIIDTVRRIKELKLEGLKVRSGMMEIRDVSDLPPGFPAGLRDLIGRLLESRIQPVLFEEVPLYHFFETEAGEKFCKSGRHRAVPILGPDQNGTEVTFNRTRVVNYLGNDRVKLFPQDGVAEEGPAEKPPITLTSFNTLTEGSWFTDGVYMYNKIAEQTVQKYKLDGEPISTETYRGPKVDLRFLSFNVLDAWDLVEEGCKASG